MRGQRNFAIGLAVAGVIVVGIGVAGLFSGDEATLGASPSPSPSPSPSEAPTPSESPTETASPTPDPVETPEEFFSRFADALRSGKPAFLLARMHPLVLDRYAESDCRAYLGGLDLPDYDAEVLSVGRTKVFHWETDRDQPRCRACDDGEDPLHRGRRHVHRDRRASGCAGRRIVPVPDRLRHAEGRCRVNRDRARRVGILVLAATLCVPSMASARSQPIDLVQELATTLSAAAGGDGFAWDQAPDATTQVDELDDHFTIDGATPTYTPPQGDLVQGDQFGFSYPNPVFSDLFGPDGLLDCARPEVACPTYETSTKPFAKGTFVLGFQVGAPAEVSGSELLTVAVHANDDDYPLAQDPRPNSPFAGTNKLWRMDLSASGDPVRFFQIDGGAFAEFHTDARVLLAGDHGWFFIPPAEYPLAHTIKGWDVEVFVLPASDASAKQQAVDVLGGLGPRDLLIPIGIGGTMVIRLPAPPSVSPSASSVPPSSPSGPVVVDVSKSKNKLVWFLVILLGVLLVLAAAWMWFFRRAADEGGIMLVAEKKDVGAHPTGTDDLPGPAEFPPPGVVAAPVETPLTPCAEEFLAWQAAETACREAMRAAELSRQMAKDAKAALDALRQEYPPLGFSEPDSPVIRTSDGMRMSDLDRALMDWDEKNRPQERRSSDPHEQLRRNKERLARVRAEYAKFKAKEAELETKLAEAEAAAREAEARAKEACDAAAEAKAAYERCMGISTGAGPATGVVDGGTAEGPKPAKPEPPKPEPPKPEPPKPQPPAATQAAATQAVRRERGGWGDPRRMPRRNDQGD